MPNIVAVLTAFLGAIDQPACKNIHRWVEVTIAPLQSKPIKLGIIKDFYYGEGFAAAKGSQQFQNQISELIGDDQNFKKLIAGRLDAILVDKTGL